jgi:small-conductance mechanosensitive channel
MSRQQEQRRRRVAWLAIAGLFALGAVAGSQAATPPAAESPAAVSPATEPEVGSPAELIIANRAIITLRGSVYGAEPVERVGVIRDGILFLVQRGGPLQVTSRPIENGVGVFVDGTLVFRVLEADVNLEAGETPRAAADRAMHNLEQALAEMREARDSQAMLRAMGLSLLATIVLAGLLWLLVRVYRRLTSNVRQLVQSRSAQLAPGWGTHLVGSIGLANLAMVPVRLLAWGLALLLMYEWAGLVLKLFPYTRPWGEALLGNLLRAFGNFANAILHALPGLLFVVLIFFVTRFVVRAVRVFFEGVQQGRIELSWVDDASARPTGRLLTAVIWLFALVAAYPYLPGSGSEAFKGIGVFVGLMLSIGASGIVNQAVSGLMLMYTRTLRPGEFVQIGETEGTVTSIGFLTTQIETLRHEEVNIPNAVIAGSVTRNYSRLAANGGVRAATKVTIGYDVPWRQVQAMLHIAAERTDGAAQEPPARVLQTALQDFYVEYTLLVTVMNPMQRIATLNELHGHIQDVFNEHGVQIMSPNYEADPAGPKVVPPGEWFRAPARPPDATAPARSAHPGVAGE